MNIIQRQTWISPKVEIRGSSVEGKGMFAKLDIKKRDKVVVLGGNYTGKSGSEKALKQGKLVMQWDEDLYSYEDRGDDDSYFINHSCNPNIWMSDAYTLIARRDIKKSEEVTADYALWEANENFISKWNCKCGTPVCRGRVTGRDWRNPKLKKCYKNHFSPLLNKRISELILQ